MGYFIKQFDDYRLNFPLDDGEGESEREILLNTMRLMNFIIMTKKDILGKTESKENLSNILRSGLNHSNDRSYDRLFLRCEKAFPIPSSVSIPESGNCYTLNETYKIMGTLTLLSIMLQNFSDYRFSIRSNLQFSGEHYGPSNLTLTLRCNPNPIM